MPKVILPPGPTEREQTRSKEGRAEWERPVLRRLAANEAQQPHGGEEGGHQGGGHGHRT